jgi:transcriptional regulator with XRE-family HTH domain
MNEEERQKRGQAIRERLAALRMSDRAFAAATEVDRKTISRAVEGVENVRASTYREIESWLDRLETEAGARLNGDRVMPSTREAVIRERRRRDWTQSDLAERAKVSRATISNFERGLTTDLRLGTMARILEALDLDEESEEMVAGEPHRIEIKLSISELTISISENDLRRVLSLLGLEGQA